MLISKAQIEALDEQALLRFVPAVQEYLSCHHRGVVPPIPHEALVARIEYGLRRAKRHGMTWEKTLIAFVAMMFEISPEFDQMQQFQGILDDPQIHPNDTIEEFVRRTTYENWREARRTFGRDGWPD